MVGQHKFQVIFSPPAFNPLLLFLLLASKINSHSYLTCRTNRFWNYISIFSVLLFQSATYKFKRVHVNEGGLKTSTVEEAGIHQIASVIVE